MTKGEFVLWGVIEKKTGRLVSTIHTRDHTKEEITEAWPKHYDIKPSGDWTDEQAAEYYSWCQPARDASLRKLLGIAPETLS